MTTRRVLVADDAEDVRILLCELLVEDGFEVVEARKGQEVLDRMRNNGPFDLVLLDVHFPDFDGLEVMELLQRAGHDVPVIMITGQGTSNTAIRATQLGAYDYVLKPFEPAELRLLISRLFEHRELADLVRQLQERLQRDARERIVGDSPAMQMVYKTIGRVARSNATVLITGETGTGKELVAETIHSASSRSTGPFVRVNCAALPETLLESELFGHEKGAFTGADKQRKGRFELADGGTIFLDEIGEMSLNTQRKLLRVLQQGEFQRVGGQETRIVDVRVLAATNRELEDDIKENRFREDLYYRLNVIHIHLPPLRERSEDIPLLVAHFLNKYRYTPDAQPTKISEEALQRLVRHDWPGNVRELENTIERAVVMSQGRVITTEHLELGKGMQTLRRPNMLDLTGLVAQETSLSEALAQAERGLIREALRFAEGNQAEAARRLGLQPGELSSKIAAYGIQTS